MPKLPLREKVFDSACFLVGKAGRAFGYELSRPLFIIGTGRCGSNLLREILESHRKFSGYPGEPNELWHPSLEPYESTSLDIPPIEVDPKGYSEISSANWPFNQAEWISNVFTGFQLVSGPSKIFFTHSAMISFMIPKILEVFPNARIIHIYRFGPSVVESYFKKNFGIYSRYVVTEKDYRIICAKYWNACILEIEKRKTELSLEKYNRFLEFSYEALTEHPRDMFKDIANFLGVDSDGFTFDITRISNRNDKTPDYTKTPEQAELLDFMFQGLKLKGYITNHIPVFS